MKGQIDDLIAARTLYWQVGHILPEVLPQAEISINEFFANGKDWLTSFCEDMPTAAVVLALAKANHRAAADRKWRRNDVHDIDALSVALPYCDVVVTEAHFCEQARKAQLTSRFNTVVMNELANLPETIEAWHRK